MKIKFLFIVFVVSAFVGCAKKKLVEKPFSEFISAYSEKSSIEYDMDYKIKFFDYDDTTKTKAHCILIKAKNDKLFGGYFWYSYKDSLKDISKYYDLSDLYIIDNNKKEVTRFELKKRPPSPITGAVDGEVINISFLKPQKLKKYVADSSNVISYSRVNDKEIIGIKFPDDPPVRNQTIEFTINLLKNYIEKKTYWAELDNQHQYNEGNLYNIQFNSSTPKDLENRFLESTKEYTFKDYQPQNEKEIAPLKNGYEIQDFQGEYFSSKNEPFIFTDFNAQIVILDFWYRSCQPCVETIPQLNRLHQKYKNSNVKIFGLNPYDSDSISKKKLVDFVKYHKMEYPIVFIDSNVQKQFNIWAYPTLYLIDRNGKVVYSKIGHGKNTEKEIDSVLNVML